MKIFNSENKRKYTSPEIICIELDKEISLAMESDSEPYGEPGWGAQAQPSNFNKDPFNTNLG